MSAVIDYTFKHDYGTDYKGPFQNGISTRIHQYDDGRWMYEAKVYVNGYSVRASGIVSDRAEAEHMALDWSARGESAILAKHLAELEETIRIALAELGGIDPDRAAAMLPAYKTGYQAGRAAVREAMINAFAALDEEDS